MKAEWIPLAKVCQRQGLVAVPPFIMDCLLKAFKLGVDKPKGQRPEKNHFGRRCHDYVCDVESVRIIYAASKKGIVVYRPVWHYLTVEEILVDMARWPDPKVKLRCEAKLTAKWRWQYWYPAFSFFWAFIYHTENEFLRRPWIIWDELQKYVDDFIVLEQTPRETAIADTRFYLALYERVLAIQYDIRTKQPHYVRNILERPELKSSESSERPELFYQAVAYLREKIEEKLRI